MVSKISGNGVSATKQPAVQDKQRELRLKGEFLVQKGMTLNQIARQFNMTVDDLKKAAGLKSSALNAGQVLKGLPMGAVKAGKGLASVAKEHGMSLKAFCELNGIKENYKPKAGERFFVYPKPADQKTSKTENTKRPALTKTTPQTVTSKPNPEPKQTTSTKTAQTVPPAATSENAQKTQSANKTENEKYAESLKTPADIARALKESSKKIAAINNDKFTIPFSKINKNNAAQVIKEYDKISPKESLVAMISSEWGNSKETRKSAITKLYDTLAEQVGKEIATKQKREAFMSEMDKEYGSWGFVSSTKMDKMINDLISEKQKADAKAKAEADANKLIVPKRSGDKTPVKLGNKKVMTSEELKFGADSSAVKNNRTTERPAPVVDKNGNIVAGVKIYNPSSDKKGSLSGKTIIINPGHGGYKPSNGMFDPGTFAENSKNRVVEEWVLNKSLADEIVPQLTSKGAKVILMSGAAAAVVEAKAKYKNADMFISIHCDSAPQKTGKRGQTIIYKDLTYKRLAESIEAQIDTHKNIDKELCKSREDERNLGVLREVSNVPSILIEAGFQSNPKDLSNLESPQFRKEFAKLLAQGVVDYVNTNKR